MGTDSTPTRSPEFNPQVSVAGGKVHWRNQGEDRQAEILELPQKLVHWQLENKQRIYAAIERNERIAFDPAHLPVVATWNARSPVPNLANKGVGFTPKDEFLEQYLDIVESAVERIKKLPTDSIDATRQLRVDAARALYARPEHIDWRRLGLLEIFEGSTFKNLEQSSMASILWTGSSPTYLSFQVDFVVEIITREDPRYRFSWAMRRLFEHESFHVVQTMFPYAYCFWVVGVRDKTPKTRCPHASR